MSFFKSISAENIDYFRHQTESIIEKEVTTSKPSLQRLSKPSSCLTIEQFEQQLRESQQHVIQYYTSFLKAGFVTLFYLNSIDSLSPNLLLTSVEHAKCPLSSQNKNKNKISLEILIEQCCEWFSHVVSQHTSSSPNEITQILRKAVIQKLQTTELNSIQFITGYYISTFEYVNYSEKNKDPTYSLCKILHDMITTELQEKASHNSQVVDLINYASNLSQNSELFHIPEFQKSLLKFLSIKTHMPEASEFLPLYFKYQELCKRDVSLFGKEKYEIALKIVAVIKKKILNMDSDDAEHIISHVQSHRNSLSDTIFTKLYNETVKLIITNYLASYSQIQFWKSSEFFEMCNSLNIPAFAVRQS